MNPNEKPDYRHLVRIAGIAVILVTSVILMKVFLTPESWGVYGHYRADSVKENMNKKPKYVGADKCADCHSDKTEEHNTGVHAGLNCEICHSAAFAHVDDPAVKLSKHTERAFCGRCHYKDVSRPGKFPQIEIKTHYTDGLCVDCHNPHSPKI